MKLYSSRAGTLKHEISGYDCFVPSSLKNIKIEYDVEMLMLLSEANLYLGKINGLAENLPDKDQFLSMYVEKEATLSAQIEGTQASLADVLQRTKTNNDKRIETEEIVNYVYALNNGIKLLENYPISLRLFRMIHKLLLEGVRGEFKEPGEIRKSQNWIGPANCNLNQATYIPPSVEIMKDAILDLEDYINEDIIIPKLIKVGLFHYQFETIHPFLDGNGRLGRLLIPLILKQEGLLNEPLLYISLYLKQNRTEYYGLLMDVRTKGKYEEWLKFFLKTIIETSKNVVDAISNIKNIKDDYSSLIMNCKYQNKDLLKKTLCYLYSHPYFDSVDLLYELNVTKPTISRIIKELMDLKIISPTSSKSRYVTYRLDQYADILEIGTELK